MSRGVGIVCLPTLYANDLFSSRLMTVAGWGTTEFGGPASPKLLKTDVEIKSNTYCKIYFIQANSTNFLCAYTPNKDTCQYDSGSSGFLAINGRLYSVSVTSGGDGCAGSKPSLNTRVTAYLQWIRSNAVGDQFCDV